MMFGRVALLGCLMISVDVANAQTGYRLPPQDVVDIIDARPEPGVSFSPDKEWLLLVERDAMPSIEDISRRMLQLAGLRIDPAANGPFQLSYSRGISLRRRSGGEAIRIPVIEGARIAGVSWSHHSDNFAFTIATGMGTELWVASVNQPDQPKRLTDRLSTVLGSFDWMPDGKQILCHLVPENREAEPAQPAAPLGPNMQESSGNTSPIRTFQDLLTSPYDESLFEYYGTSQVAIIDLHGRSAMLGSPGLIDAAVPSPDGIHFLVTTLHRPFSYLLTYGSFPRRYEVWDRSGQVVHQVVDMPLEENVPIEGVRTGPRSIEWSSSQPATLNWAEALDGGDPRTKVAHRDRYMSLATPFADAPKELFKVEHRAMGLSYFRDSNLVLASEYDRDRRWIRSQLHRLDRPDETPRVFDDRSMRDRYNDPGRIVSVPNESGHSIALQHGALIYLAGQGASPEGLLPFLDRRSLESLAVERIWRCEPGCFESPTSIMDVEGNGKPQIITRHESPSTPPNYFLRDLVAGTNVSITQFTDPTPQIRNIKKEIVKYKRADGVDLSATLYLPADHKPGQRLPLFVWAYPMEFNDPTTAGQIASSPWQFTRMSGLTHLTLVTQGYAVMDAATMPVIGDPETMNDTFVEQIVGAAKGAIDKAAEMGVADPNRVGIGGHSYGAFMTANLMAHCDLFRAGIARSGAYNRTLTPFGFQAERRPLWEAKDIYLQLSPFMYADKINEPLLLIHGENDNNPGTFPIQSQRLYQAIKGNGGTARLVMLPFESHGYSARESVLHTQAEMIDWLNKHVRDASQPPNGKPRETTTGGGE